MISSFDYMCLLWILIFVVLIVLFLMVIGIRIVTPNQLGIKIRNKRFVKKMKPGFHWVIPVLDKVVKVNTEDYDRVYNELVLTGRIIER
jgi:regulator of protease activity HflC (stomatin/prohibitin superfamily)